MSYSTVNVSGSETYRVGSGETLSNILFDLSGNADLTIVATGRNWTIENIGLQGGCSTRNTCIGLRDAGGSSTFRNVYMGDGVDHNVSHEGGAIFVHPEHAGHIDFQYVNIQGWADNGIYASAPGMNSGNGGTINIDRCFSANNYVANFRMSEGELTNSCAVNHGSGWDGRCLWAWAPGPVNVDNCVLDGGGRHYSMVAGGNSRATAINVENTQWNNGYYGGTHTDHGSIIDFNGGNSTNPTTFIPDGVPRSAEAAASTQASDPDPEPPDTDARRLHPLPPRDPPSGFSSVITGRALSNQTTAIDVWLESRNTDDVSVVGTYASTDEAITYQKDDAEDGLVRVSMALSGRDNADPDDLGAAEQSRKVAAIDAGIYKVAMGSEASLANGDNGPVQLDRTNGNTSIVEDWHPEDLEAPPDRLETLSPVNPAPHSNTILVRSTSGAKYTVEVFTEGVDSADDWDETDDYDSYTGRNFEGQTVDENLDPVDGGS